ncbi:MAG: riboflavin synthase [Armatimonadetes bacterium]|nr:riboflavin synthase [Armatimonadota bacterium]
MFTGLVEEVGAIAASEAVGSIRRVRIGAREVVAGLGVGDSVSVDGVCLTATSVRADGFNVDLGPETLRRTSLGDRAVGDAVNLERALAVGARLAGHVVQGHVDGTGVVSAFRVDGETAWLEIETPPALRRYIAEKGSISVDGVSLTVASIDDDGFGVMLIPHTLSATTLSRRQVGHRVNLEVDILAKYVEGLLTWKETKTS